jgi:hypothetical protein
MKRTFEFIGILFMMSHLISCDPNQLNGPVITPSLTNTYTPTNTVIPNTSPTPQVSKYPTRKHDPTGQLLANGWYRFNYPEAGYLLDYPPDAHLSTDNSIFLDFTQISIGFPKSVDYKVGMYVITYLNTKNISLNEFVEQQLLEMFHGKDPLKVFNQTTITETTIAGHSAIIFDANLDRQIIFIKARDKFYTLVLLPDMISGMPTTKEAKTLFYMIVDTFTIFESIYY